MEKVNKKWVLKNKICSRLNEKMQKRINRLSNKHYKSKSNIQGFDYFGAGSMLIKTTKTLSALSFVLTPCETDSKDAFKELMEEGKFKDKLGHLEQKVAGCFSKSNQKAKKGRIKCDKKQRKCQKTRGCAKAGMKL